MVHLSWNASGRWPVRITVLTLLAAGALAMAGCASPSKLRLNQAERFGKVYYLDGIGCYGFGKRGVPEGLRQAGYMGDFEYWNWSATRTPLDQIGGPFVREKGKELAKLIDRYCRTYPGRPISLIGLSGGTGVAVFACEYLPEDVMVDEVVLIASSLSDTYNLAPALKHIRGGITLFQTNADFALGVGARLTGTIDGMPMGTCAGITGFQTPPGAGEEVRELYAARVTNVPYDPAFSAYGFDGGHTSAVDSPMFVRMKIAPLVLAYTSPPDNLGQAPLKHPADEIIASVRAVDMPAATQPDPSGVADATPTTQTDKPANRPAPDSQPEPAATSRPRGRNRT